MAEMTIYEALAIANYAARNELYAQWNEEIVKHALWMIDTCAKTASARFARDKASHNV